MLTPQYLLPIHRELVVVFFAGAGGSCTGIEAAIQRHVDIAANHNEQAISCHRANHPQTRHHIEDVRRLDPRKLAGGLPVGYFHASPDCTHFSQAKGGQPRSAEIRALPWIVPKWGGTVRPDVITLENVKEIQKWGRLIAKRDKATGRVLRLDGTVAAPGEVTPRHKQFLIPDPKHEGKTWARYLATLRGMGYDVDVRVLCAADYGVPTTRSRLFLIARCDGLPITWPAPTHFKNPKRGQKKWIAAHTCIDFTLPSRSIFEREKPLADATLRRVARGMKKFVLDSADPFIVPVTHSGSARVHDIREPLRTVTTAQRGEFMVASPVMIQAGYGEAPGQLPRVLDLQNPLGVVVAGGGKHALATTFLAKLQGDSSGSDVRDPTPVITAGGKPKRPGGGVKLAAVTAFVEQANGGFYQGAGHDARAPVSAITTTGSQQRLVQAQLVDYHLSPEHEAGALRCAAFLLQYYSEGGQWSDLRDPANSITTRDRLALVTVWIKGDPYVVVDICLRMLTPRELANATSFPPQYILSHGHDGRIFTKSQQVFFIGNAVPPLLQQAVTAANYSDMPPVAERMAA